jgi:transcriptional regulator with XRE-family HTH domain
MDIGERLKQYRESKGMSQAEMEQRTKLLRCYISRVENGHTVPTIETLERFAVALDMPLYQFLYEEKQTSKSAAKSSAEIDDWASRGKGRRVFFRFQKALGKMTPRERALLLHAAEKMVSR